MQGVLPAARRLADALAALLLFLMMGVTFVDVLGRYVLNRPIAGSADFIRYLLVFTIFIALPVVSAREEHISISLVDGWLGARANRVRRALVHLACAAVMVAAGWFMWRHAEALARNRDVIGYLRLPLAPAAYAVSLFSWATGLLYLAMAALEGGPWRSRSPAS